MTTIIIVHWNTPETLKKQLTLLGNHNNLQLIVIDNASTESLSRLKKEFSQVKLIENEINRGYAAACNQGTTNAVGDWLLFLNPDVEITPKQIEQMVEQAEEQKVDACSPITETNYQKPLPTWFSLLAEFTPINRIVGLGFFREKALFGGCLLIKKTVLENLGGWDERFFLWFEDSDLSLRLIKNNYRIGWVPINIKHEGGASFKNLDNQFKRDIFFNSMAVFAKKYFSFFGRLIVSLIKRRYSKRKLLPEIFDGTSVTVPNLKLNLLTDFFKNNQKTLKNIDELIVVSSALNSRNIWEWRREFPPIRFIPLEKNEGFAKTVNIGFRVSTGKWAGTINDDIILTNDWFKNLFDYQEKNIGSLNPVIFRQSGETESVGIDVLPKGKAIPKRYHLDSDRKKMIVDAANAACVLYSKEALNKVGLFDEKFGSYLEDIDLSLRFKRADYKNIVCLTSSVIHLGQATSKELGIKKQFYDARNWIYVIFKNWGIKKIIRYFPEIFIERLRNFSGAIKTLLQITNNK